MAIKKAYQEIVDFLRANMEVTVGEVITTVEELAAAKKGGGGQRTASTVKKDADGNVIAIFCYYHKQWEDPSVVEYGARASSPTGLNNMCKEGTSQWTKQQNQAKKDNEALLQGVLAGEITPEEARDMKDDIEEARKAIVPREDGHFVDLGGESTEDFEDTEEDEEYV